jgi:hypothetical protein
MDKKTQSILGVVALGAVGLYLWNQSKKNKVFANAAGKRTTGKRAGDPTIPSCQVYEGACLASGNQAPVATIITGWVGGTDGIIVANSSTRCIVCPRNPNTLDGMPSVVSKNKTKRRNASGSGLIFAETSPKTRKCPTGQVKCPNKNKCYDPRANYVMNPCA